MEDYWNEYQTVRGRIRETRLSHSEDDYRSHDDDSDDTFLETVLPDRLKEDREISETELTNSHIYYTLTEKQRVQLIRRTEERNATLRQKRMKIKTQKPDLWSIFSGTDNSSTGTRSRSATPDSLDSISPPRTPPDHSPKNWVDSSLSRSRASLDSGHHSLIMSSSSPITPSYVHSTPQHIPAYEHLSPAKKESKGWKEIRKQPLGKRFSPPNLDTSYCYSSDCQGSSSRIYRPSSLDMLSEKPKRNEVRSDKDKVTLHRQRSYANDIYKDLRQHYVNKGLYEFTPRPLFGSDAPDVRGIHYKQIGSMHIPQSKPKDRRRIPFDQSVPAKQDHSHNYNQSVRRTNSIKHHPRDPFDNHSEKENNLISNSNFKVEERNNENTIRSKGSTDLGFRVLRCDTEETFPDVVLEVGRGGQTKMDWLHESDMTKLMSLALLELDIIFSENHIHHGWRKRLKKNKFKEVEHGVFGASLEILHGKDENYFSEIGFVESKVPQILQKLVGHLELRGIRDEGILRIPGNRAKTEELRRCLDKNFYESRQKVDAALRNASANEIAALFKLFLRELPQPLLTYSLALAFYKSHKIQDLGERILALTMLIILLPNVYRDTLKAILDLCSKIVANERENKMGLYNVSMIIAPNVFLPNFQPKSKIHIKHDDKEHQLNSQMEYAKVTTELMQALIKYKDILWTVPYRLIAQVRHQYDSSHKPPNYKSIHKLLGKKNKELIQRPINNEVDYQNGIMRITASQFSKVNHPIKLDWKMTARDILARFIDEQTTMNERPNRVSGRREQKQSTKTNLVTPGILPKFPELTTCLLRGSLKHALDKHALHERGGNITERRIDHNAYLIAVYQDNPNGEFLVKCHHPGGQIDFSAT